MCIGLKTLRLGCRHYDTSHYPSSCTLLPPNSDYTACPAFYPVYTKLHMASLPGFCDSCYETYRDELEFWVESNLPDGELGEEEWTAAIEAIEAWGQMRGRRMQMGVNPGPARLAVQHAVNMIFLQVRNRR
jgi:hypothetical protein